MEEMKKKPELQEIQTILEGMHEKFIKMSLLIPENRWEQNENLPNFQSHFILDDVHNTVYARGEGDIPASPQEIAKLLSNNEQRIEYDDQVREARCLVKYNDQFQIQYIRMKAPAIFMDDREFIVAFGKFIQQDGTINIIQKSIDYPMPLTNGVTRAIVHLTGFILKPNGENKTHAIFIGNVDPQGSVPDFVKRKVIKQKARMILELTDIFENKLKKK